MQPLHMYLYLTFVAHSYGKRAKMTELTANLPFGEFFRGRFAKQLCLIWGVTYRKGKNLTRNSTIFCTFAPSCISYHKKGRSLLNILPYHLGKG